LPGRYEWLQFRAAAQHLFALGFNEQCTGAQLVLIRKSWQGAAQGISWDVESKRAPKCLFDVEPQRALWTIISPLGEPLAHQSFPISERGLHAAACGTPHWLPSDTIGLTGAYPNLWLVRADRHTFVLECRDRNGKLVRNSDLEKLGAVENVSEHVMIAANSSTVAICGGPWLLVRDKQGAMDLIELEQSVRSIASYAAASDLCLAIAMESRVVLYHAGRAEPALVADDLHQPHVVFTGNGNLVVAVGTEGRIYQFIPAGVRRVSTFRWNSSDITALLAGPEPDQFASVSSRGTIRLFKLRL
jgi:hypothetical protein